MDKVKPVFLFIHELFGIYSQNSRIQLLTPDVSSACKNAKHKMHKRHTYKIARFKNRTWSQPDVRMRRGHCYRLSGVEAGSLKAGGVPPDCTYNAHPNRPFQLAQTPYCHWDLDMPSKIHQLRLLNTPDRPLFKGTDGDAIEKQVKAISLVQVFEYVPNGKKIEIIDNQDGPIRMDYKVDKITDSINLHIWAEIENEAGMTDAMADEHSKCATAALMALFKGLDVQGQHSLSIDNWYPTQVQMPGGNAVRFVELMSLSERFALRHPSTQGKGDGLKANGKDGKFEVLCSGKTCGKGSNFFVDGKG